MNYLNPTNEINTTNHLLEKLKAGRVMFDLGKGNFVLNGRSRRKVNRNVARYVIRAKFVVESGEAGRYVYNINQRLLGTFDNESGVDVDDLKSRLRGKHGWLTVRILPNDQVQLVITKNVERNK